MPLDARRFKWSPGFPVWLQVIGGLVLIPQLYLIFESTAENTFASPWSESKQSASKE